MSERLTLALPIDVARAFDAQVTQTQLESNTFQGSTDDRDYLASLIGDAEDEFRQHANVDMRLSRVGTPGRRETYEEVTYKLSGHKLYRQRFSHATFDYTNQDQELDVANGRILPFDAEQGDEVHIWRGLDEGWEDITADRGESWELLNNVEGTLLVSAHEVRRAMHRHISGAAFGSGRQTKLRLAVTYRYGALGGSRGFAGSTALAEGIDDTETGAVDVDDANRLPIGEGGGSIVLLLGEEYVLAGVDLENDQIQIEQRGLRGTNAESHADGDRVQYTPPSVRKAVAARAGVQLILGSRYYDWLPDADDELSKDDMQATMEQTWERTIEAMS